MDFITEIVYTFNNNIINFPIGKLERLLELKPKHKTRKGIPRSDLCQLGKTVCNNVGSGNKDEVVCILMSLPLAVFALHHANRLRTAAHFAL